VDCGSACGGYIVDNHRNRPGLCFVNKRTEFRVTILASFESGQINPESGQIKLESGTIKVDDGDNCANNGIKTVDSGSSVQKSGQIKWPDKSKSGQIKSVKAYDTEGQDRAVLDIVCKNPGIKLDAIFLEIKTSTRSVRRVLERLASQKKIEYRGSKRTGGWFIKT